MTIGTIGLWSWLDHRVPLQFWMFPVGANDRLGQVAKCHELLLFGAEPERRRPDRGEDPQGVKLK
jgi:hypothetical protein